MQSLMLQKRIFLIKSRIYSLYIMIYLHCSDPFHCVIDTKATTPLFVNSVGARVLDSTDQLY